MNNINIYCTIILIWIVFVFQLIIEPLRALIESQVNELKRRKMCVENLLTQKDATENNLAAGERLHHILTSRKHGDSHEPLILFSTPELLQGIGIQAQIQECVRYRLISMIVVDEFDEIQNATKSYREAYLKLIPDLRVIAPNVPLFLLSATLTKKLIVNLNNSFENSCSPNNFAPLPHIYRTSFPLPMNHIYRGKSFFLYTNIGTASFYLTPFCSGKKNKQPTGC